MGFVALGIYLAIVIATFRDIRWLKRSCRDDPALAWARDLASMTQVGLITFLVGAAALSMQFWEGFWLMVVLIHSARSAIEHEWAPNLRNIGGRSPLPLAHGSRP
jgi:hypothetical protein